jgi:hypothetical protein
MLYEAWKCGPYNAWLAKKGGNTGASKLAHQNRRNRGNQVDPVPFVEPNGSGRRLLRQG